MKTLENYNKTAYLIISTSLLKAWSVFSSKSCLCRTLIATSFERQRPAYTVPKEPSPRTLNFSISSGLTSGGPNRWGWKAVTIGREGGNIAIKISHSLFFFLFSTITHRYWLYWLRLGPLLHTNSSDRVQLIELVARELWRESWCAKRPEQAVHHAPFLFGPNSTGGLGSEIGKRGGKNHILILLTNKEISQGEFLHVLEDNQVIRI